MVYPVDSSAYMLQEMKIPIYNVRKIKFINYIIQLVRVERHSVALKLLFQLREKMFKPAIEPAVELSTIAINLIKKITLKTTVKREKSKHY